MINQLEIKTAKQAIDRLKKHIYTVDNKGYSLLGILDCKDIIEVLKKQEEQLQHKNILRNNVNKAIKKGTFVFKDTAETLEINIDDEPAYSIKQYKELEERNKVLVQALNNIIKYQQQSYKHCPCNCQEFIDARDIAKFALGSDINNG